MQNSINVNEKCRCSNCQTEAGPVMVNTHFQSRMQIFTDADEDKVMDRYNKFVNYIRLFNTTIHGSQLSTALGTVEGESFVQFTVAVYFDIPNNVTDEILAKGLIEEQ